jgi:hypothetical protein
LHSLRTFRPAARPIPDRVSSPRRAAAASCGPVSSCGGVRDGPASSCGGRDDDPASSRGRDDDDPASSCGGSDDGPASSCGCVRGPACWLAARLILAV